MEISKKHPPFLHYLIISRTFASKFHTPCFTLIEQALSVFLTLIMFNDPWVLPDEVCVIVFTFFHEGEYDP